MLDLQKIQFEQEEWLRENRVYEELLNRKGKKFYFLDGPPYANDIPHLGHLKVKIIKDVIIRFKFMQGYRVYFKPGFDTHGLPIENTVEKKLGLKNKNDILTLGINKFLEVCKKNAAIYKDAFLQAYKRGGILYFLKEPYLTYENYYIESAWWTFKRWWEKGLVYKGYKPVHYCSHCQTSLAGYEVTDSYIVLKDPSVYVLFKLKEKIEKIDKETYQEVYILVWTTTPWTLASNVALAIRDDTDYVLVKLSDGKHIILAESRLNVLTELGYAYEIVRKMKGKELLGLSYEPLLDIPIQKQLEGMKKENPRIHTIIASIKLLKKRTASKILAKKELKESEQELYEDFVNLEEGTGVVHIAGGHGTTDYEVSIHYNLPSVSPLDDEAKFDENTGWLNGIYVKDADRGIIKFIENKNMLLASNYISHKYPVCWRCKTPLIVKLNEQYFVDINPLKKKMIEEINRVKWFPSFAKERILDWTLNAEDWNISRQRFWGIPMPIWQCTNTECNEVKVISGLKELSKELMKMNKSLAENFDLHQVSEIKLLCDVCNSLMQKVRYVFDVWFDSSIAAWASLKYPYYDEDLFDEIWPADWINEGQDQIRGWFYYQLFSGVATFNKAPYNAVNMVGWVVDAKGEKMSKSLGNMIFAKDVLEKYGADLCRYYIIYDAPPYTIQAINLGNILKEPLKFFNVLFNIYNFYKQLGPAEKFHKEVHDEWLLSRLNKLIKEYTYALENFELNIALRKLYDFVLNDFSRFYIKLVRNNAESKKLFVKDVLKAVLKLAHPVTPFFTDWLWRKLKDDKDEKSILLEKWPNYNKNEINDELEKSFEIVNRIIESALFLRAERKTNVRWPLSNLFIFTDDLTIKNAVEKLQKIIKEQVNVVNILICKKMDITKEAKIISNELWADLSKEINEELFAKGLAREIIRHIQASRKKLELVKENAIVLEIILENELKNLLERFNLKNEIKGKTNAKEIFLLSQPSEKKYGFEDDLLVKEKSIKIRIQKVSQ